MVSYHSNIKIAMTDLYPHPDMNITMIREGYDW